MNNKITYLVFLILLTLNSCYEKETLPSDIDRSIAPSLSLPLGDFEHDLNNYFDRLADITTPTADSIILNFVTLPNPETAIEDSYKIDFRISQVTTQFDAITGVALKLLITNEYPTDMEIDLSFIKLGGVRTGSILPQPIHIDGATLNTSKGIFEHKQIEWIVFPDNIIENIEDLRTLVLDYTVYTKIEGVDKVKFNKLAKISLHMGLQVDLEFNL